MASAKWKQFCLDLTEKEYDTLPPAARGLPSKENLINQVPGQYHCLILGNPQRYKMVWCFKGEYGKDGFGNHKMIFSNALQAVFDNIT